MMQHGVGDERKVCELALNAGVDMDMVGEIFLNYGVELVKSGKISPSQVDTACRRILEAKYKLGLFTDPYRSLSDDRAKQEIMSADKMALSREAAIQSMVLLKNSNDLLPLAVQKVASSFNPEKKIAFIGPLVKDHRNLLGSWSAAGDWKKTVSIWQALDSKFGANKFLYAKGCNLVEDPALLKKLNHEDGQIVLDEKSPRQLIDEAVQTANQADVVVAVVGEPFGMSGEAASRSNIGLLENQSALLKALKQTGKPIVLVLMNGRPLSLTWEDSHLDAILEAWYGGTMSGAAIVDMLFGDTYPTGRLTMSFPRCVGQIPVYYNHKNTGRPFDAEEKYRSKYLDVSNEPLYPFGYGLSYGKFDYGDIGLSSSTLKPGDTITVSTTIQNSGKHFGFETVQLYVRDLAGSITRPVKELKGFQQVGLKPGESKTVEFKLSADNLKFYNSDLQLVSEPGDFKLFVGPNSRDVKETNFKLLP
jgi:beta-glucosidase